MEKPVVLLADDDEATCTLVRALLRHEFELDVVHDGQDAVDRLRSRDYAAILLDLRMPGLDGYGVLDFLASERADVLARVLVVTASLARSHVERVRSYGVCGVVAKPFEIESFYEAVRQCAAPAQSRLRGPLISTGMILLLAEMLVRARVS